MQRCSTSKACAAFQDYLLYLKYLNLKLKLFLVIVKNILIRMEQRIRLKIATMHRDVCMHPS